MTRGHFIISGTVQGVCFRMYARDEARRLGIHGWVRNLRNGCVETVAEGDPAAVHSFRDWCQHGPAYASVAQVEESYSNATGEFDSFRIVY